MNDRPGQTIIDFSKGPSIAWEPIDDRIMGGVSQSQAESIEQTGLRFSGHVSLENNGGFASIRSDLSDYNLSQFYGPKLRVRGDGRTYKISLRTDVFFDGVSYQASFSTQAGAWQEVDLNFENFIPTHHGIKLTTLAPIDTANVKTFGFFIADRQDGPFQLDIAWIKGLA